MLSHTLSSLRDMASNDCPSSGENVLLPTVLFDILQVLLFRTKNRGFSSLHSEGMLSLSCIPMAYPRMPWHVSRTEIP